MAVHELEEKKACWGFSSSLLSARTSVRRNPHDKDTKTSWPKLFMYVANAASLAGNLMVLWPVLMREIRFIAMAAIISYRQGRMKLSAIHDYMGNLLLSLLIVLILLMKTRAFLISTRSYLNFKKIHIAQWTNFIKSMSTLSAEDQIGQSALAAASAVFDHEHPDPDHDTSKPSSVINITSSSTTGGGYIRTPSAAAAMNLPIEKPAQPAHAAVLQDHIDYPEYSSKSASPATIMTSSSTTSGDCIEMPPAAVANIKRAPLEKPAAAAVTLKKQRSCSRLQLQYDRSIMSNTGHNFMSAAADVVRPRPRQQANAKEALNRLSGEEFRSRVESFVLKHRKRMWAELLNDESCHYILDRNTCGCQFKLSIA